MVKYILRRLVISIVTIWLIATASFFLLHLLPGNPFSTDQLLSQDMIDQLMDYYGLNEPLWKQYLTFMGNLLHGDFGTSYKYAGQSVNGIIAEKFPISAQLGLQAFLLSLPLGVFFGIVAARKRGKALDYGLVAFAVLGVSVPVFIIAEELCLHHPPDPDPCHRQHRRADQADADADAGGHIGGLCENRQGQGPLLRADCLEPPDP